MPTLTVVNLWNTRGRRRGGATPPGRAATRLTGSFGTGLTLASLDRMRQFYRAFPEGSALPIELAPQDRGQMQMYGSDFDRFQRRGLRASSPSFRGQLR